MKALNSWFRPIFCGLNRPLRALRRAGSCLVHGRKNRSPMVIAGFVVAGFVLWLSRRETVPYIHRNRSILLPLTVDRQLGSLLFSCFKLINRNRVSLESLHDDLGDRVKMIGSRLLEAVRNLYEEGFFRHTRGMQLEFLVVKTDEIDALAFIGGKVVIFAGLGMYLTDGELAAVLAHEIAHVIARHSAERIMRRLFLSYVNRRLRPAWCHRVLSAIALNLLFVLPFTRRTETEADLIAVHLMEKAQFDPRDVVHMLEMVDYLEKQSGKALPMIPTFLRKHPLTSTRIQQVDQEISGAMPTS